MVPEGRRPLCHEKNEAEPNPARQPSDGKTLAAQLPQKDGTENEQRCEESRHWECDQQRRWKKKYCGPKVKGRACINWKNMGKANNPARKMRANRELGRNLNHALPMRHLVFLRPWASRVELP